MNYLSVRDIACMRVILFLVCVVFSSVLSASCVIPPKDRPVEEVRVLKHADEFEVKIIIPTFIDGFVEISAVYVQIDDPFFRFMLTPDNFGFGLKALYMGRGFSSESRVIKREDVKSYVELTLQDLKQLDQLSISLLYGDVGCPAQIFPFKKLKYDIGLSIDYEE